ncbi:MAG: dihydroorotate dehydrogenase-like protein [Vicinamibacterales bacterium]
MDLTTTYLGLRLAHPFMVGASPLVDDLDTVKRLEDGGSSAIVLHSLFEEQITMETRGEIRHRDPLDEQFSAMLSHFPAPHDYALTTDRYLEQIRRIKQAVGVPVIASLNGTTGESWMRFASHIEQAGADALEVNFYEVISDPERSSMTVEAGLGDMVTELKRMVRIPIALKLSPYFTALGNLARRLDGAGLDGLILFNRFYQPDIDVATLSVMPRLELSTRTELRLRLQWVALLRGRVRASLAVTGGVSTPTDGIKAVLAGADAVQIVAAILRHGPEHFGVVRDGLARFMDVRGFRTVEEMKGAVSFTATEDPAAFQRANYIRTLQSWSAARAARGGRTNKAE